MHTTLKISIIYTKQYIFLDMTFYLSYMFAQEHVTSTPQEASDSSLPYCTLLGVLWQMCRAWITHGIVTWAVLMTDRLSFTRRE